MLARTLSLLAPLVTTSPTADLLDSLLPSQPDKTREAAFEAIAESKDDRYFAPLIDLLRFADTPEEWFRILDTLGAILGEKTRQIVRPWRTMTLRIARDPSLVQFDTYAAWKGELLAQRVDPRFREFLFDDVTRRIRLEEIVWGGVEVDGIPALDHAAVLPGRSASYLADDEPVFGISIDGESRAYPLRILDWHEMANDTVGGTSFALAYCTLCGAGVAYRSEWKGDTLRFGSSGLLMRSNKLMYDDATMSLWNQLTGEPVVGPMAKKDVRLETLPVVLTRWGDWLRKHPETTVLDPDTGFERDYRIGAAYGHYFGTTETMFPAAIEANGGPAKERMYVVRLGRNSAAFPLRKLRTERVLNATVGDVPVVLAFSTNDRDLELRGELLALAGEATRASQLDLGALQDIWRAQPSLVTSELLLALAENTRLEFFDWAGTVDEEGVSRMPETLRDNVVMRSLASEVRAFRSTGVRFAPGADRYTLTDSDGSTWRVSEEALQGPEGARLERLPGHMVYRFGWEAFFAE